MTLLNVLKAVMRRLREATPASLDSTTYSTLVTEFINDTYEQLVDAHRWSAYEHVIDVPVDANQRVLDLTDIESGGGDIANTGRATTDRSILSWADGRPLAWVFDDSSATDGDQLIQVDEGTMERLYQQDRDQTNDEPRYFSLRQSPSAPGFQMTIWPTPTTARHIRMRFWTPEAGIDATADDSRVLLVPSRPLILGALMLALNERGEEIGEPGNIAERRYYDAVSAAIEADTVDREKTNVYEFWRD